MEASHLFAVRKKIRRKITECEELQEHTERDSLVWKLLEREIEELKKQLFRLEFMVYNGGE